MIQTRYVAMKKSMARLVADMLTSWEYPEGLTVTVSIVRDAKIGPGYVCVFLRLFASEGNEVTLNIERIPTREDIENITKAAQMLLDDAWDQPSCDGLCETFSLDMSGMGRDS